MSAPIRARGSTASPGRGIRSLSSSSATPCGGADTSGLNSYRPFPAYQEGETIPFAGQDEWSGKVAALNEALPARSRDLPTESPIETTRYMIDRLREGTVKR